MAKPPDRTRTPISTRSLIPPINVTDLKTYPLKKRHSKVRVSDFAKPWRKGDSCGHFYRVLPDKVVVVLIADGRRDMHALMTRRLLGA